MAVPPPPPPTPGKGTNIVSGRTNPYSNTFSTAPTIYNSSITPVTYNGFQWSFNAGVSWGRFISGEPFIIVPAAGVNVIGVSYEGHNLPRLVTGFTSAAGQASLQGITFYISGSMKNPPAWWEQRDFNFTKTVLGATVHYWNYDERICANSIERKGDVLVKGSGMLNNHVPFSEFLFFPIGLSAGDNLVTAKSSFNSDPNLSTQPQGTNKYVRWTNPEMSRMCIEKYAILTALSVGPTYSDCYRPPVFWNGASLSSRPLFYRRDMVKNTESYVTPSIEVDIKGFTLNYESENIIIEQDNWNNFVNEMWISSHIPYYSGPSHQVAVSAYDLYNDKPETTKAGYMGTGAKIKDQMMQSVFAPWVSSANRKKALDKVTQFAIDCWGIPNAGGIFSGDGGYHAAAAHPWIVWLGWLYNRSDMIKYYNGAKIQNRLGGVYVGPGVNNIAYGYTGNFATNIASTLVPLDFYYKSLLSQDYSQRYKFFGASIANKQGFTGFVSSNSEISLYHGLTSASISPSGACGFGWLYKETGISAAYSYTLSSIDIKGQIIPGSFGVVAANKDFVFRLNGLGPGSEKPLPAKLPLVTNSSGNLLNRAFTNDDDCGSYWAFDSGSVTGLKLKITNGPGAGNTAYRILATYNNFLNRGKVTDEGDEEEETTNNLGVVEQLQYASFILDRDFDIAPPTSESTFSIYHADNDETNYGFVAGGWARDLKNLGITKFGSELLTVYQQPTYNNIADEAIIKHYSLHNWLGITEDQFLIDYVKGVYFNNDIPSYTRREKIIGSAYVGSIVDNGNKLGGAIVAKMLGISGEQYVPLYVDDLGGIGDNDPSQPIDNLKIEFIPEYISNYVVDGGSGKTYSGYGYVFSEPQTILRIVAIIDDKLFTEVNQPGLYNLIADLKIQTGPFLSNSLLIEEREDEDIYLDRVSFIDYGKSRGNALDVVYKDTSYIRKPIDLQSLAVAGKTAEFKFITNRYGMAGAVGIIPYPGNYCKLSSSYGMYSLTRGTAKDENKFRINLDTQANNTSIDTENLYYCIASPRIGTNQFDMAEEYIYDNWKKIENSTLTGNEIIFSDPTIPFGSVNGFTYGSDTTDKLIFFKYIIDKSSVVLPYSAVEVIRQPGITNLSQDRNRIQSSTILNWATNPINTIHKIQQVIIKNSAGNDGVFDFKINGSTTSTTDYRAIAYNNFRIWNNNYSDIENATGFKLFSTFQPDAVGNNIDTDFFGKLFGYNAFITDTNGVRYYSPKSNTFSIPVLNGEPGSGVGFYDWFIHGQTMNVYMPLYPQTLYYITS
jgi:hypothetical protein